MNNRGPVSVRLPSAGAGNADARKTTAAGGIARDQLSGTRRQPGRITDHLAHDLLHGLSTIRLLADLLRRAGMTDDVDGQRARHIVELTHWLDDLVHRAGSATERQFPVRAQRVDLIGASVVEPVRLSTGIAIDVDLEPAYAEVDRLALWRMLRNLVLNGAQAAGPAGRVLLRVRNQDDLVLIDIEDDGPGMSAAGRAGSLGLGIVGELSASAGALIEFGTSNLGGCWIRITLAAADEPASAPDPRDQAGLAAVDGNA